MSAEKGGFVLIVGPSGAGKDTLLQLARSDLAGEGTFRFPRRIVTRPSSPHEDHDTLDEDAFARAESEGRFALSWRAHGLGYAIPQSAAEAADCGCIVACNVSRKVVEAARARLPNVLAVEITAPPEVLARRLAERGRGEDGDLGARLARSAEIGAFRPDVTLMNDRAPERGAADLVAILRDHATGCYRKNTKVVSRNTGISTAPDHSM